MHRRAFAIGSLALGAGVFLSTHRLAGRVQESTPAPDQEATPSPNNVEGQLFQATRTYQATTVQSALPLLFQFRVFVFDSENNAKPVVSRIAQGIQDLTALQLSELTPRGAPNVGDDRVAFSAKVDLQGTILDAAFLIFREGTAVHLWFAAGLDPMPLDDLVAIAEGNFGAVEATPGATPETTPEATPQTNAEVTKDTVLGLLPDVDDLPEGYDLKEERVQSADDVATPAS